MNGQPQTNIVTFNVTALGVTETAPPAFQPWTIIPRDQPFRLHADFNIDGLIGRGLNDLQFGGQPVFEYNLTYYSERIGRGGGIERSPAPVPCQLGNYSYTAPVTELIVPANSLRAGNHMLTVVVKMSPTGGGSGGFPWHITGFVEGPMIEIYQP